MGGGDVHATKLFTQFSGRETDTSSCLAFAPKTRNGNGVSKSDWQVDKKDDFLKLEPWAVPCDNAWMKDNVNKWQGYSFYFGQKAIEKCVKVTFAMGMQPVVAFVGGLQFDLMPAPLAALDSQAQLRVRIRLFMLMPWLLCLVSVVASCVRLPTRCQPNN